MINLEKRFNLPIAKNIKYWIIAPLLIILVAGILFGVYSAIYKDVTKGMNIGIDFAGGSVVTVTLGDKLNDSNYEELEKLISSAVEDEKIGTEIVKYATSEEFTKENKAITLTEDAAKAKITYSQTSGSGEEYAIVLKYDNVSKTYDPQSLLSPHRNQLIKENIANVLAPKLGLELDEVNSMITTESIGATASLDLIKKALLCLGVSLVLILIYIIIRFEIWSGLAAVVALIHDVLILIALTIVFRIQVNSAFIAAIITIVSYSINNTIVVFDRLRENMKNENKLNVKFNKAKVVDKSIAQTLQRSINATVTTMVTIVIFAIFGSSAVNEFALPVIFGLLAGFYSSMFVAPSLYYSFVVSYDKHKEKKLNIEAQSKPKYAGVK